MTTATETAVRAGRREWLGLAVLALPALLLSLDISVLLLALPQLSTDLGASTTQQLWITDIYGFMIAGFLVTMGTLGDRIGRRRLLLIGAAAFGVASVLAAYSTSPEMLIATRALLGIAGATVMPSTLALVSNMFGDPRQRGLAIAAVFSCFMAGGALGPVVGGVLLQFFWWGSVFLLGVPVMLLLLAAGPLLLPEYRAGAGGLDLASVALSLAAILPVIYGVKELATSEPAGGPVPPIAAILVGVAAGVLFVLRQRRLSDPLLDLRLFGNRSFRAAVLILLLGGVIMGGTFLLVTQYLQLVQGLSPLSAGLWMLPPTVSMIVGVMAAPPLTRRIRPGHVMSAGLAIGAAGFLVLTRVESTGGLTVLVVGFSVALFGLGLPGGLGVDLIVGSAPPERAGSAASISTTSQELGIALGLATLGSLGTAVYRRLLADTLPAGIPAEAAEAARESFAGAVSAAAQLRELLDPARAAFTSGLSAVVVVGAVLLLTLAILAAAALRHIPSGQSADSENAADG